MFPNMSIEVLEAVEEKFKNDEEILIDCLVYLAHLGDEITQVNGVEYKAMDALQRMERCPHCGTKYEVMYYKEYHPEVDAYEDMADMYCPNCDIR